MKILDPREPTHPPTVERIAEHLRQAEEDLARQVNEQQQRWRYRMHRGRIWFDEEIRRAHQRLRQSIPAYIRKESLLSLVSAPVIYSLIVPLALLDLWISTTSGFASLSTASRVCDAGTTSSSTGTVSPT